jgi:hypothetical protein
MLVVTIDGGGDEATTCVNLLEFGSGPPTLSTDVSTVIIMNATPGIFLGSLAMRIPARF